MYNAEKYIERCLKSLFGLKTENEIIVVNDGSTDNSLDIVEKFRKDYPKENIIVITQENRGAGAARNVGLKHSIGKYISFIDSDDFVDTKKYEEIIRKTIENDLDVGLGNGNYIFDENEIKLMDDFKGKNIDNLEIGTGFYYSKHLYEKYKIASRTEMVTNIYKKEFLYKNNIFFNEKRLYEDVFFIFMCMIKAKRIKYFDLDFYKYIIRKNSDNIMSKEYDYNDLLDTIDDIKDECRKIKDLQKRKTIEKTRLQSLLNGLLTKIYIKNFKKYKKEIIRNRQNIKYIWMESKLDLKDKIKTTKKCNYLYINLRKI